MEAMIKRSKEILKQIAGGIFLYCLLCLGGATIHDEPLQLLLEQTNGSGGFEWYVA